MTDERDEHDDKFFQPASAVHQVTPPPETPPLFTDEEWARVLERVRRGMALADAVATLDEEDGR